MAGIVWAVMQGSAVRALFVGTEAGRQAALVHATDLAALFPRQRPYSVVQLTVREG